VEIESEWTARDREIEVRGGVARVFVDPPGTGLDFPG